MTLLANAGIYLILDVNSPKPGQNLNRYEPWTSYNPNYINHVLKVVHQFAGYNNTLGFFAGNEVINDDVSAKESPHYIKATIRDMHQYMRNNSPRVVPIGYSAADDLRFRTSLAKYFECGDSDIAVDFYGVNSYQWCGYNTFETSGFDILVRDYEDYTIPLFLSEYGCNALMPRLFQEVEALYSDRMTNVFSGGLIYEFAQEPNNYGLVDIAPDGSAQLLPDYDTLKVQYNITKVSYDFSKDRQAPRPEKCKKMYANLMNANAPVPDSPVPDLVKNGVKDVKMGSFVHVKLSSTLYSIVATDKQEIREKKIAATVDLDKPMQEPSPWKELRLYNNIPKQEPPAPPAPLVDVSPAKPLADVNKKMASPSAGEKLVTSGTFKVDLSEGKSLKKIVYAGLLIAPIIAGAMFLAAGQ